MLKLEKHAKALCEIHVMYKIHTHGDSMKTFFFLLIKLDLNRQA